MLGPEDLALQRYGRHHVGGVGTADQLSANPGEAYKAELLGNGMSEAMVQGLLDMKQAKDKGLDNVEPRTPRSTTPTSFRQWCEEVLKPAVSSYDNLRT